MERLKLDRWFQSPGYNGDDYEEYGNYSEAGRLRRIGETIGIYLDIAVDEIGFKQGEKILFTTEQLHQIAQAAWWELCYHCPNTDEFGVKSEALGEFLEERFLNRKNSWTTELWAEEIRKDFNLHSYWEDRKAHDSRSEKKVKTRLVG